MGILRRLIRKANNFERYREKKSFFTYLKMERKITRLEVQRVRSKTIDAK